MMGRPNLPLRFLRFFAVATALTWGIVAPRLAVAHCDTLAGPVVQAAQQALDKADVTPVLKRVKAEHEAEIRTAFRETLAVRAGGPAARQLADRYFFETVVRIHRQGEGAPYSGLKPAGTEVGPAIEGADRALQGGSVEAVTKLVTNEISDGLRTRFAQAMEKKQHAEESVAAGREFVAAYVEFVHYVERLHQAATSAAGHREVTMGTEQPHQH